MSDTTTFCVNHPKTPTVLRCNKCGRPMCTKCVVLGPVGYRCKDCMKVQQAGYYNALPLDYVLAIVVGFVVSAVGGFVMSLLGGFWLLAIFAGPIAGGIIAEAIRMAVQRRRGRYFWLIGAATVVLGGLFGLVALPLLGSLGALMAGGVGARALVRFLPGAFLNLGFLIYVVMAVSTVYARLKV